MQYLPILLLISLSLSALAPVKSDTNPFTEKAAILRYWNRKIPNSSPHPPFLVSKLTPLSISDAAMFSTIASNDPFKLSSTLASFCSAAALLCSPELAPSLASHLHDTAFSGYVNDDFANYAEAENGGLSSFHKYHGNEVPLSTFARYGHNSIEHINSFTQYGPGNVDTGANFTSYGVGSGIGVDKFHTYANSADGVALGFNNYATNGTAREAGFNHYSDDAKVGQQLFSTYGKGGNVIKSDFATYSHNTSDKIESGFSHYGENGRDYNNDTFTSYSEHANIANNNFDSYGSGSHFDIGKFTTYSHQSNIGNDSFTSYQKGADFRFTEFNNYGNKSSGNNNFDSYGSGSADGIDKFTAYSHQSNIGNDSFTSYQKGVVGNDSFTEFINYGNKGSGNAVFKEYGKNSTNPNITFKSYIDDSSTFTDYHNKHNGIQFQSYLNSSSAQSHAVLGHHPAMNLRVEAGRFFRESSLKEGTVMPMPDIRDRMLPRAFLPRSIAGKIPLSVAAVTEIFKFLPGTAMANSVASTVGDCERLPSRGETKWCATSAEDMIDFAVSVLGNDIQVRSTNNTKGSKGNIMIGEVKGIDGGKVTESVSCHQSLFPYLVYYCHSVPRVRLYEAEILAVDSREKINHGVAICHIDTSDWSPTHGAFVALGPGPGKIEVCHWIFEGDMTWTVSDRASV